MAYTQRDGRWFVYYRVRGDDGKSRIKWESFGRGRKAMAAAIKRHNEMIKNGFVRETHRSKVYTLREEETYKIFEMIRAQCAHKKIMFEINTKVGLIDAMTEEEIIEIKPSLQWKQAIGQLICYGSCIPDKKLKLFLFGGISIPKLQEVAKHCAAAGIGLRFCGDISTFNV